MIEVVIGNTISKLVGNIGVELNHALERKLSYIQKGAQFTAAFKRRVWDGRTKLYKASTQTLPTGLVSMALELFDIHGVKYVITDTRRRPEPSILVDWVFEHEIRDYQLVAIAKAVEVGRGILNLSTGSGKSIVYMKIIHEIGVRTLLIVNTIEALRDMRDAAQACFGPMYYGVMGDGNKKQGILLTIITGASLRRQTPEFFKGYEAVVIDECFPAGTMISMWDGSEKRIEELRLGDVVTSFNNISGSAEGRKVTHVFNSSMKPLITIKAGNMSTSCSYNHPYYVRDKGYVEAINLEVDDELLILQKRTTRRVHKNKTTGVLQRTLQKTIRAPKKASATCYGDLRSVRERSRKKAIKRPEIQMLLRGMYGYKTKANKIRDNARYQYKEQGYHIKTNEGKKSNVYPRGVRKAEGYTSKARVYIQSKRRKWERYYSTSKDVNGSFGPSKSCSGVRSCNWPKRARLSELLQNRYWYRRRWIGYRGRWEESQHFGGTSMRQKERQLFNWKRVESVAFQEQGNTTRSGKSCGGDTKLYNLEVEDNNNYFANGALVHNCHHMPSASWTESINKLDVFYRIGGTGTNFRTDNKDIVLQALTGKVLAKVNAKDLQEKDVLQKADIYFVANTEPTYPSIMFSDYLELYTAAIVENDDRNKKIVEIVAKHLDVVKVILVSKIAHGEILLKMIKEVDPTVVYVDGSTKKKVREQIKQSLVDGGLRTVIASVIYNESVDIPRLGMAILAAGGTSGIQVVQRLGRILRKHESKDKAIFYDFLDFANPKLHKHSLERLKMLKKEGHHVEIIEEIK